MNKLPPEILAHIIASGLDDDENLAQYSTISRAWKASIERHTFRKLTIRTDKLDKFAALFAGDNIVRWVNLAKLIVDFVLPVTHNADGCCAVVQRPNRKADSAEFSASVAKLFTVLADLSGRAVVKCAFFLHFRYGRRRAIFKGKKVVYNYARCRPDWRNEEHTSDQIHDAKAVSGQFELLPGTTIPTVRHITKLEHWGFRELEALKFTWLPEIMAKLPDVEILRVSTSDSYSDGRRRRMEHKACLLSSLCSISSHHLRQFKIHISNVGLKNEHIPVHNLLPEGDHRQEPYYSLLKNIASFPLLAVLKLYGGLVVTPEFFQAITTYLGAPFPKLIEFELQFSAETADGRWFFQEDKETIERSRRETKWNEFWREEARDGRQRAETLRRRPLSDYPDDYARVFEDEPFRTGVVDRHIFRSRPEPDTLLPFLLDAAVAIKRIPSLKKFILKLGNLDTDPNMLDHSPIVSRVFELWYLQAGMHRSPPVDRLDFEFENPYIPGDAAHIKQNRLYWRIGNSEIWEEVHAAWMTVVGPDAKIVFMEEGHWRKHYWGNEVPVGYKLVYDGEF